MSPIQAVSVPAASSASRARTPVLLVIAVAATLVCALRFVPWIDEPWDRSTGAINGGFYFARVEQYFQRLGFARLRGAPTLHHLPLSTDVPGTGAFFRFDYPNHPVLCFWLLHGAVEIGGWSERVFRSVPIFFSSLSAGLLTLLVGRFLGARWAAVAALLYATLPMSFHGGAMVSYEPVALSFMVLAVFLHLITRRAAASACGATWIAVFLASSSDWAGSFVVPALVAFELMTPRAEGRSLTRAFGLAVPATLAVLTHVALVCWWKGSVSAGLARLVEIGQIAAAPEAPKGDVATWWANQWTFATAGFTVPGVLLALGALPFLVARARSSSVARLASCLAIPAMLSVGIFRNHAFDHDFWWYHACPYVVVATVAMLDLLTAAPARARALRRAVAVAVVAAMAALGVRGIIDRHDAMATTEFRDFGESVNHFAAPADVLIIPTIFERENFYVRPWLLDRTGGWDVAVFHAISDMKRQGRITADRVVILLPDSLRGDFVPPAHASPGTRRYEAAELASLAPAFAARYAGEGAWVITLE